MKLISIAVDTPRNLKKLKERYESPYQWIADRKAEIAKSYKVYFIEGDPNPENHHDEFQPNHAIPSKFLINKEGVIVWRYIGTKTDRPPIEDMMEAIEKNL